MQFVPLKLRPGNGFEDFIELRLKPGSWDKNGIPEEGCRIRTETFHEILANGGSYDPDVLIRGLMDWLDVTDDPIPAIVTLRQLLDRHHPPAQREHATCRFEDVDRVPRTFTVGTVDTERQLVTWQRDSYIFGLGQPDPVKPQRIIIAVPAALPLNAALRILGVAMETFMQEPFDSFQGAVTMSGGTSNFYAWERGQLTTCFWPHGLGRSEERGQLVDRSLELYPLPQKQGWLAPNQVAMLIAIAAGYVS